MGFTFMENERKETGSGLGVSIIGGTGGGKKRV